MRNNVKCRSGLRGWQSRLQEVYVNFEEFTAYAEMYGTHLKLGFNRPANAWKSNPMVQGSVEPSDFCKIIKGRRVFSF
jgi:hypothetical protein